MYISTCMKLRDVMLSKNSQTQKHTYSIIPPREVLEQGDLVCGNSNENNG